MTRYELVKKYSDILRECATAGVTVEDYHNAKIYDEVQRLRADGLKMQYCVTYASDKFAVSESKVWAIVRHMRVRC